MILLDTSALIDALTGPKRSGPRLRQLIADGERVSMSAIVAFEWRGGPRSPEEIADQEALFPIRDSIPFSADAAIVAAESYRRVNRPRGREFDIAVAASAIAHDAVLWTLKPADFKDIPNLKLLPLQP